jgi:hypothetical protein
MPRRPAGGYFAADVERGLDQIGAVGLHAVDDRAAAPLGGEREQHQFRRIDRRMLAVDQQVVEPGLGQDLDHSDIGNLQPCTDHHLATDDFLAQVHCHCPVGYGTAIPACSLNVLSGRYSALNPPHRPARF